MIFLFLMVRAEAQVVPLVNGHAHNDYWHIRPLQQAVENGFMSVEADVHLIKGRLLVGHESIFARNGRSLENLYIKPLFQRAKDNNFSSIYTNGPKEFILYIDIKEGCPDIGDSLISLLRPYRKMLTVWTDGVKHTGAVSIIIGACGLEDRWLSDTTRWFYFDAGLGALSGKYDGNAIGRVSASLRGVTHWRGVGKIPSSDLVKIREVVKLAHEQHRTVRFWAATNRPKVWAVLLDAGVDWMNVDRLARFKRFMSKHEQ